MRSSFFLGIKTANESEGRGFVTLVKMLVSRTAVQLATNRAISVV